MIRLTALLAVLFPSLAFAQAEPTFTIQPEPAFEQALNDAFIPLKPKDAFVGVGACAILDAKTFRAYTLPEAVKVLQPCLAGVSAKYAVSLKADRGVVATTNAGRGAVLGIVLVAGATDKVGNSMIRDLNYAIASRGGRLLGFVAVLRGPNDPAISVPSAAQDAIDRCMLPQVLRKIESGDDFIRYYGGCLRRAPELKVDALRPWPSHPLGVEILTENDGPAAEGLNGVVTVRGESGPVLIDVVAYPKNVYLP